MTKLSRRAALLGAGGVAVTAGTWAWLRARGLAEDRPEQAIERTPPASAPPLPGPAFDPRAEATLRSLYDELLPGQPELGLPSASEADVFGYVKEAARLPGLRPLRDEVLKLARHLDRAGPRRFVELDVAERTQLLLAVSSDTGRTGRFVPSRALEAALRLGLEGYLGHPHHGGNQGFVAWEALRIRMPRDRAPHRSHG